MSLPFPVAEPPSAAEIEAGRKLFTAHGGADFLKGVVAMDGLPPADRVEVCFAGRSMLVCGRWSCLGGLLFKWVI